MQAGNGRHPFDKKTHASLSMWRVHEGKSHWAYVRVCVCVCVFGYRVSRWPAWSLLIKADLWPQQPKNKCSAVLAKRDFAPKSTFHPEKKNKNTQAVRGAGVWRCGRELRGIQVSFHNPTHPEMGRSQYKYKVLLSKWYFQVSVLPACLLRKEVKILHKGWIPISLLNPVIPEPSKT